MNALNSLMLLSILMGGTVMSWIVTVMADEKQTKVVSFFSGCGCLIVALVLL